MPRGRAKSGSGVAYPDEYRFCWTEIVRITKMPFAYLAFQSRGQVHRHTLKKWCEQYSNGAWRDLRLPATWYQETPDHWEFAMPNGDKILVPKREDLSSPGKRNEIDMTYKMRVCAAKYLTGVSHEELGKYVGHMESIRNWWSKNSDAFYNNENPNLYGLSKERECDGREVVPFVRNDGVMVKIPVRQDPPYADRNRVLHMIYDRGVPMGEVIRRLRISETTVRNFLKQTSKPDWEEFQKQFPMHFPPISRYRPRSKRQATTTAEPPVNNDTQNLPAKAARTDDVGTGPISMVVRKDQQPPPHATAPTGGPNPPLTIPEIGSSIWDIWAGAAAGAPWIPGVTAGATVGSPPAAELGAAQLYQTTMPNSVAADYTNNKLLQQAKRRKQRPPTKIQKAAAEQQQQQAAAAALQNSPIKRPQLETQTQLTELYVNSIPSHTIGGRSMMIPNVRPSNMTIQEKVSDTVEGLLQRIREENATSAALRAGSSYLMNCY